MKESLGGLEKALKAVVDAGGRAIVIVNPHHGDLSGAGEPLTKLLKVAFWACLVFPPESFSKQDMTTDEALRCYKAHSAHTPVMIHAGFSGSRALSEELVKPRQDQCHIFFDRFCGKLYQKHFKGAHRVLLKDGFQRKRNRDYELVEPFSDHHATFTDEGMDGFGDFSNSR